MNAAERVKGIDFFAPTLLIGLGLLLLLNNAGLLPVEFWRLALNFWPLLLIAIGVNLLIGRSSNWIGIVIALLLLAVILVFAWVAPNLWTGAGQLGERQEINMPMQEAKTGDIRINTSVSELRISAGQRGGELVAGEVTPLRNERINQRFEMNGDTARFILESQGSSSNGSFFMQPTGPQWNLKLNPQLPIKLTLNSGVGQAVLDLSELRITELVVNGGVGNIEVTLPTAGELQATVKGSVGRVVVSIPATLAANIEAKTGIGALSVRGDYQQNGDFYKSTNYDSAKARVRLMVESGIGAIEIRQIR
jgi:predicted membrane protein